MEALLAASQMPSSGSRPFPSLVTHGPRPTASAAADTQWLTSRFTQHPFHSKLMSPDHLGITNSEQHDRMAMGGQAGAGLFLRQQVCWDQVGNPAAFHSPCPSYSGL